MRSTSIYQRGTRIVTAFVVAFAGITASLPFFLTQNTFAATNEINGLAFGTTEQTIYENQTSGAIYLVTRDNSGELEPLDTPGAILTIHAPSGSGQLFSDAANPSGDNTLTLAWEPGSSQSPPFYYRNSQNGTYLLTATLNTSQTPPQLLTTSQNIYVVPDTTPPEAPANGSPNGNQTNTDPVAFSWQAPSDNLSASDTLLYDFRFSQSAEIDGSGMLTTGTTREKLTSENNSESGLSDSTTYFWQVRAYDEAGNLGAWSTVWNVGVDRTAPIASLPDLASEPAFGGTTIRRTVTFTGSCNENPCTLKYTLDDGTGPRDITESVLDLQTRTKEGVLVYPSGTYTVSLIATDTAGNQSSPATTTFTVDNTAPGASISNDEVSQTGGTIQPNVTVLNPDNEKVNYNWVRATNSPNSGALDASEAGILQPTFTPKTAGLYRYILTVCDDLKNCSSTTFSFTWEPSVVPVTDVAITNAVANTTPPAGLVATKFNTTSPTTLGLTSENSTQVSSTTAPVKDEPAPTKDNELEATYTDDSSARMWWVLLVLAIGAAGYYAYRNWQLTRPKD